MYIKIKIGLMLTSFHLLSAILRNTPISSVTKIGSRKYTMNYNRNWSIEIPLHCDAKAQEVSVLIAIGMEFTKYSVESPWRSINNYTNHSILFENKNDLRCGKEHLRLYYFKTKPNSNDKSLGGMISQNCTKNQACSTPPTTSSAPTASSNTSLTTTSKAVNSSKTTSIHQILSSQIASSTSSMKRSTMQNTVLTVQNTVLKIQNTTLVSTISKNQTNYQAKSSTLLIPSSTSYARSNHTLTPPSSSISKGRVNFSTTSSKNCSVYCKCRRNLVSLQVNMSDSEIQKIKENMSAILKINKEKLQSRQMKKRCADDNRKSAMAIGWVGGTIICFTIGAIITCDVLRIFNIK